MLLKHYRQSKNFLLIITVFFFALIDVPVKAGKTPEKHIPFSPGEKLTFELKWGFISAGTAVLEVLPFKKINNVDAYHFTLTIKSSSYIDLFYKVRSRFDAYSDAGMNRSLLYTKKQLEGKHKRDVKVTFDWEKNEGQYSNFGKKKDPVPLMPGCLDPLSSFFYLRCFKHKQGMKIHCTVADGKKCVVGKAKVLKKEKIKINNKTYNTFKLEPDLKDAGGIFKKSKNAKLHIWLTDDKRRMPVKLKSKVVIGSFTGELISVETKKKKAKQ